MVLPKASQKEADQKTMLDWKDSYSVDVHTIDAQHKNLFRIAADLQRAMVAGETKGALPQIVERLVQYTAVHLAFEERLMQEAAYPELQAHKLEHEKLKRSILQFQKDLNEGRSAMAFELLQFLKIAIREHILGSDQKYAPYLKNKK
jgi:hemerythrin